MAFDGLIAVVVAVVGVATELAPEPQRSEYFRDANAYSVTVTLAAALLLILRRRHPVAVYLTSVVTIFAHGLGDYSGAGPWMVNLCALYAVAAYGRRRWAVVGLVSSLVVGALSVTVVPYEVEVGEIIVSLALPLAAWLLGDNMRIRRAYIGAVEDRAEYLEREQDAQAKRAVAEERNRIARELHDIVAHNMSVMVVQAGAARRTLDRDPHRAAEAIGQIEATGRGALDEMRRLVGVLRRGDHDEGRSPVTEEDLLPQPGLQQIPALIDQWCELGMDAAFHTKGRERPLPAGMELVLYRIVQEALTNVAKHAGPAASVQTSLVYKSKAVTLAVVDDGRGAAAAVAKAGGGSGLVVVKDLGALRGRRIVRVEQGGATSPAAGLRNATGVTTGHGLVGMAERVALYDGEMRWGPHRGGGFQVWARLPLPEREDDTDVEEARPAGNPVGAS